MGDIDPLNSMLIDISKQLNESDLSQMKFMCKDIIKRRDMEKVKGPLDLFTELQTREKLTRNDTSFLKQLLLKCEKQTAVRIVEQFENPTTCTTAPVTTVTRNGFEHQVLQQAQPVAYAQHHEPVGKKIEDPVVAKQLKSLQKEFTFLAKNLGREWRFFMRALDIDEVDMDGAGTTYGQNLKDQIYQTLVFWVKEKREKATKTELIKALRDGSVERNDLASKLQNDKY